MRISFAITAMTFLSIAAFAQSPTTQPVPIQIAKDTTFILAPLKSDGTPDYLKAYNAALPQIPPEKNAYTLIFQATGPLSDPHDQKQMLESLQLQPFPLGTHFLQGLGQFNISLHLESSTDIPTNELEKIAQLQDALEKGLISAADQPLITQWVDAQSEPMKLLEKAAERETCVIPLVPKNELHSMIGALPLVTPLSTSIQPFFARANLRASHGDFSGAQDDLVTALRLSRLIQQTPLLIVRIIGSACETRVCRTARVIALNGHLSADQLLSMRHALATVPPSPSFSETYNIGERFAGLDLYTQIARSNMDEILRDYLLIFDKSIPIDQGDLKFVDWNIILRAANQDFDQTAKIFSSSDWREIRVALQREIANDPPPKNIPTFPAVGMFSDLAVGETDNNAVWERQRSDVLAFLHMRPNESREDFTKRIQYLFQGPSAMDTRIGNLSISRALEFPLTQTTLALAEFHAEHQNYPTSLSELVPQYISVIPEDPFSDNPIIYHPTSNGFLLYSVGPNSKDDGGNSDHKKSQDDIAITCPMN